MTTTDRPAPTGAAVRPLGAKERAMWLFREYAPDDGVMNVAFAVEPVGGPLDTGALRQAVVALVARHPALRTRFPVVDGEPVRVTDDADATDAGAVVREESVTDEDLPAALRRATTARIEIATDLPLQVTVIRSPTQETVCVAVDHLVYDAHSAQVLEGELARAYAALAGGGAVPDELRDEVPAPPIVDGAPESTAYWRETLAHARPSGDLDVGRHAPRGVGFPGDAVRAHVDDDVWPAAEAAARAANTPVSAVAMAAFATVLARHGAGTDLVFGVPTYNRGRPAHDAVGYYMSVLPVRVTFAPETTFTALARLCAERMLDGLQYADASIDEVQAGVYERGGETDRPLVRYLFNYLADLRDDPAGVHGVEPTRRWRGHRLRAVHSRMDLDLAFWRDPEGVLLRTTYASDLFTADQVTVLLARMQQVLRSGAADPTATVARIDTGSPDDARVLAATGTAADPGVGRDVLEDVATSAFAAPEAVAFGEPAAIGYGALVGAAETLAGELRAAGVTPGSAVAVGPAPLATTCAGVLGCWAAGCVAVLDDERGLDVAWRFVAAPGAAGAGETVVGMAARDAFVVFDRPHPDDLALTAAGPGGPVSVTHAVAAAAVDDVADALDLAPSDIVAVGSRATRVEQVLVALTALRVGAQVVEGGPDARTTVLVTDALTAARLVDTGSDHGAVTRVVVHGGPLPVDLAARAAAAGLAMTRVTGPHAGAGIMTVGRLGPDTGSRHLGPASALRVVGPDGAARPPLTRGALTVHGVRGPADLVVQLTAHGVEQVDDDPLAPVLSEVLAHPAVRYAAARVVGDDVTVLIEPRDGAPAGLDELVELTARRFGLPVEVTARLTLGPDGRALAGEASPEPDAPAGTVDTVVDGVDIVALWCEVLGRDDIGPDDNFFALGGDSLQAARVVGQLKKRTGRKVPLRTAFKFPTPAGLAAALQG